MVQGARQYFTFEEYARLEAESPIKHEFLDGQVWAMAGGSPEHSQRCANVIRVLGNQLLDSPCNVHTSDLKVRVRATGLGTYPDISVICGDPEVDPEDPKQQTVVNPRLLVEVLSPSTEQYDRGEKLSHYRKIETLEDVVLVAWDRRAIDVCHKSSSGWSHEEYTGNAVARLHSIECDLPLDEVYRGAIA